MHCLKSAEPVETKVAVEEKVNGKRKTAPISETKLKKVKEEALPSESIDSSVKGGTSKTTIIIPTSSASSTGTFLHINHTLNN